ncbi:hypothetical protein EDB89DRAFT_2238751 [Lactarius sanguifluus]|nr:hypothetical protein EDB89DRAFT_2238751 [Lactarius sanguifluus]
MTTLIRYNRLTMKRPSDPTSALTPESKHAKLATPSSPALSIPVRTLLNLSIKLQSFEEESTHEQSKLSKIYAAVRPSAVILLGNEDVIEEGGFIRNVREQSVDFYNVLRKAVQVEACAGDIVALITHNGSSHECFSGVMKTSRPEKSGSLYPLEPQARKVSMESQNRAIENSWTADFVDPSPLEGLRVHIAEELELGLSSTTQPYGRYCSIIQSSGMGKSRLLDEFSKNYFMIPINLRHSEGQGYPPADHKVRNFLTDGGRVIPHSSARYLIQHFLLALFDKTAVVLKKMGPTKSERIRNFRDFMSKDQSMGSAGKNRNKFYEEVIAKASEYESHGELGGAELSTALKALQKVLNSGDEKSFEHSIYIGNDPPGDESSRVDIFVAFDEAHTLADSFDDQNESRFVVLRQPLFSFFLSTAGKITQSGQPRGQDASNRINEGKLTTPRPYIYLGFDQLMQKCIAHMGRPLWGTRYDHGNEEIRVNLLDFAVQKLLCGKLGDKSLTEAQMYAVLSQRLALDINTPQYLFNSASPLDAMRTMHEQIANHMRVCVAVGGGIESLRGIAPSEPILSEAASDIMLSKEFDLPRALSLVLTGFSVDQGDRGELLVAAFFAWARDRAIKKHLPRPRERVCFHFPVNDLFEHLFSKPTFEKISDFLPSLCHDHTKPQRPLGKVFGKGQATMHFNHVVKPQVPNANPDLTPCTHTCTESFDLDVKKVGFIIVQVKNDSNTSQCDDLKIFQNMDPFKCGILDLSDTEDGQFPIPIIRIVFSISGPDNITCMSYNKPSDGAVSLGKDGQPLFTSYDFMCSGIGFFGPVRDSLEVWRALVNKPDRWSFVLQCAGA